MKYLILLLFFPFRLFAQDVSGVWVGYMYNDTTRQNIQYELAINESEGKLSGYSHMILVIDGIKNIGVKSVKIKFKDNHYYIVDDKFVYNNYTEPPAKGVKMFSFLTFSENDTAEVLSGIWRTNRTKIFRPLTGTLFLEKKKAKITETPIITKLTQLGLADRLKFLPSLPSGKEVVALNKPHVPQKTISRPEVKEPESNPDLISKAKSNEITALNKPDNPQEMISQREPTPSDKELIKEKQQKSNNFSKVEAKNKEEVKQPASVVPKKIVIPPPAAEIAKREIETIRTVDIKQDSLTLSLFDNGAIDGDTVSVVVNGQVVMPRVGLKESAINKIIHLTPEMGDSISIVMYAENLGSIPPNTGLLVVRDGEKNYEIRFSGDLKKNSKIILIRKSNK